MIERMHMEILLEVDRSGTLTGAAKNLCLTQPALSHTMKKLEERLGTPVWTKEGRSLILTQAGKYLLNTSRRLLPQIQHAEEVIKQIAEGKKGQLRIGMECHPCYQWLLNVISEFLDEWPDVDVDVKQEFQFGAVKALLGHSIDIIITPDPVKFRDLLYIPVFDYQLVLAVSGSHHLAKEKYVTPEQVARENILAYPIPKDRLDIYTQFLTPAHLRPCKHKEIETTDIMLQLVASGRGVTALPQWLVRERRNTLDIKTVRLGKEGIWKQVFIGIRKAEKDVDYIKSFIDMAENGTD